MVATVLKIVDHVAVMENANSLRLLKHVQENVEVPSMSEPSILTMALLWVKSTSPVHLERILLGL